MNKNSKGRQQGAAKYDGQRFEFVESGDREAPVLARVVLNGKKGHWFYEQKGIDREDATRRLLLFVAGRLYARETE